jgi:hypothetical protein
MADNELNLSDLIIIGGWLQKNTLFDFSAANKNCPMTQNAYSSDRIASGASARAARYLKERGSVRRESRTYLRLAGRDRRSADCASWLAWLDRRSAGCGSGSVPCATRLAVTSLSGRTRTRNFAGYNNSFAEHDRKSADCATWAAERGRRSAECATWAAGLGRCSAECVRRLSRTHHAKAPSLSRQPRTKNQELLFPNTPP